MAGFSSLKYKHVKHCSTHPKFLHSNSTSHRWAFGAIAELIDNAIDPDVNASQFCIDLKEFNNEPCLVLMDNGCGLNPERLHKMLSFGHSKKQLTPGDKSIGKHGNGFKSGTIRLGKDVLVLTKCATSMTAGFLSQTFLADVGAEDILIPLVSWELKGNRLSPKHADIEESLQAICTYSIFPDEASILAQLDAIPGTGTILIISNLRRHEGVLEMDYKSDPHDIRITSEITNSHYQQLRPNQPHTTDVPSDYSLRAYVSILYKVPRMQIFIRDNKVKTKRISGILSQKVTETYKPMGVSEPVKIEMGFNTENRNLYGMMLYHRNRLIKPYMRVGMQLEENERGMGVLGIVEAEFLQPTHNKQDFDDTTAYRRLLKKLSDVLAEYWWEKKERVPLSLPQPEIPAKRSLESDSIDEDVPDVVWVQCDNPSCLKWRVLPEGTDPTSLPDSWYCEYHPDPKYRKHEEAEQEWDASIQHEIVERRKERKREYDRERKEKEAHRRRQRLEVIVSREEQMAMQRQREAFRKEIEDRKTKDIVAIEQDRKAREDEVQRLQKELNEMQAKRDEIQEQHNELLKRLESDDGKKTSISNKKPADDNHVQFSEHEMSQVGVSGSEDLSEERPVDSQKNDDACSIRQNDVPQIQWKEAEVLNRPPLDGAVTHSTNRRIKTLQECYQERQETHFLTPSVEDETARDVYQDVHQTKKVEDEGCQHRQATYFSIENNDDVQKEARGSYQHQQEIRFPGGRTKDAENDVGNGYRQDTTYNSRDMQDEAGQSYQHQQSTQFLEERNKDDDVGGSFQLQLDARFPNKRNKTLDHELAYQHRQDPPQVFEQHFSTQSVAISGPGRHFQEHRPQIQMMESSSEILDSSSNQLHDSGHNQSKVNDHYRGSRAYPSDGVGISMATGAGAAAPAPMPQHALQDCLPGFVSSFPHAHQSKQPTRAPSEHVNHGNTLGPLSSFQNVNMPQSEGSRSMYQDGSRPMLPRSEDQHHVQYPALASVALNNDVQSRLTNGTFSESLSLCSDSMLVPRVDSSGGLQRREAESSLILSLQGRLRMVLKTLLKIAGPLEAQTDVDEILLSDLEVVTICEKAKALVGMRWQAYEQEISKLKAELAYTMADKLQTGQNFRIRGLAGDTWD